MDNLIPNTICSIPEKQLNKINMLASIKETTPSQILNTGVITYFANTIKPNLKDYQTIYLENGKKISAYSARLEQKGKNPWKKDGSHGMPKHLEMVFEIFGDDNVNSNLLEYACRLINFTLDSIFEGDNEQKITRYREAINQPNFLYMMLQIAVRLLSFDLKDRGIPLENETMNHMVDLIKKDKKQIKELFINCFDASEKGMATTKYYEILSKYFENFLDKNFSVTGEALLKIGKEQSLVDDIGEEILFTFLGYLIGELKNEYTNQLCLFGKEAITIK